MKHLAPTLALFALLGATSGCSHIKATVDVYRGELPSQGLRALELDSLATQFVTTTTPLLETTASELSTQCEALASLRELKLEDAKRLKERTRTPDYKQLGDSVLEKVSACTGASTYDAKKCRVMADEWKALSKESYILHAIKVAHGPGDDKFGAFITLAIKAQPDKAQKKAYKKDLKKAHESLRGMVSRDFKPVVETWAIDKTTYDTEIKEPLAAIQRACLEHKPALAAMAHDIKNHAAALERLKPPATKAPQDEWRQYNLGVAAEITAVQILRLDVIAASRATADDIDSALKLFAINNAPALPASPPDTSALQAHLGLLGELRGTIHTRLDPRDHNIPIITNSENRELWNRIDVDRLRVQAAGRSRYIVVQDSPINFRLKELNSDPSSVVKFGLTAADVGLEVLSTVITKGALSKGGGSGGGSEAGADPAVQARLTDETTAKVAAVRGNLLRDLETLAKELPEKANAQQVKDHAARLKLLLDLYEGDLKNAVDAAKPKPKTTASETTTEKKE